MKPETLAYLKTATKARLTSTEDRVYSEFNLTIKAGQEVDQFSVSHRMTDITFRLPEGSKAKWLKIPMGGPQGLDYFIDGQWVTWYSVYNRFDDDGEQTFDQRMADIMAWQTGVLPVEG